MTKEDIVNKVRMLLGDLGPGYTPEGKGVPTETIIKALEEYKTPELAAAYIRELMKGPTYA